jgi:hypothetical protein
MDVHQARINAYQHPGTHHLQHSQPLQQPPPPGFAQGFVPFPHQYYGQQGQPQGLNTSYPTSTGPLYNTAPPNGLRYPQQFNLPVHNGVPIQRPQPPPQLPRAPVQSTEVVAQGDTASIPQIGKPDKHLKGLKYIPEPPDKELWRHKLFDVDGLMILTDEQ